VVAVIINHFHKPLLPSGYLGVDVFFVISGFVITASLANRRSSSLGDFLAGFYERRLKRLVPALALFVLITSLFTCLFNPEPLQSLQIGARSLIGISNLSLYKASTDYFGEEVELNSFVHTWSLGVEEQFYLLFPLLVWFTGFGRQTAGGRRWLLVTIGGLALVSLVGFVHLYRVDQPAAYFLMPSRFWEMAAGCLLFLAVRPQAKATRVLQKLPGLAVLAALLLVMTLPLAAAVPATLAAVLLTCLLILCIRPGAPLHQLLTNRHVVYIGLISYSLYLWHWGVLSIGRWAVGLHWWSTPLLLGLMLVLAIGSYELVETPLRRRPWLPQRWQTLLLGLVVIGASFLAVSGGVRANERVKRQLLGPPLERSDLSADRELGLHCDQELIAGDPTRRVCRLDRGAPHTLFVVGDSHAEGLVPLMENPRIGERFNLVRMARRGAVFPVRLTGNPDGGLATLQRYNNARIDHLLRHAGRGDVVVVANHYLRDFDPVAPRGVDVPLDAAVVEREMDANLTELERIGNLLKARGAQLILFAPMPNFQAAPLPTYSSLKCGNAYPWQRPMLCKPATVEREAMLARRALVIGAIQRAAERSGAFVMFDPFPVVCPPGRPQCSSHASAGQPPLFLDTDHLSRHGVRQVAAALAPVLEARGR